MRAWAGVLVVAALGCARRDPPPPKSPAPATSPTSPPQGGFIGVVRRAERLKGEFSDVLLPYSLSFTIPEGIELSLSKPKVGAGYEWVSPGEPGAIIIRWKSSLRSDELLRGDDPAGAMSTVLIQSFKGTAENLVDRAVLPTPPELVGAGWRVDAPTLTGWIAIYTNAEWPTAKTSEKPFMDVFVIVVLGAPGTPTAYDGSAAKAIRESVRFEHLGAR